MRNLATGKKGTLGKFLPDYVIPIDFRSESLESGNMSDVMNERFNLIHLAGVVGESRVLQDIDESRRVNVDKTIQLANYCLHQKLNRFFYISSSHVYSTTLRPISEQAPINPTSEYAKQKIHTENSLKKIFIEFPEKLCILRVFSVLSIESQDFTLGAAIRKAATNNEYKIFNVDDERDFLHPRQIVEIILKLLIKQDLPQVINICSGTAMSVREVIQQIASHKDIKINPKQLIPGNSVNPRILGDATLLKTLIPHDHNRYKCFD